MAVGHLADLTAVLTVEELSWIRSMLSDQTISAVYVRTESDVYGFDWHDGDGRKTTTTLVDLRLVDARRMAAALGRIGHRRKPAFGERLAAAYAVSELAA